MYEGVREKGFLLLVIIGGEFRVGVMDWRFWRDLENAGHPCLFFYFLLFFILFLPCKFVFNRFLLQLILCYCNKMDLKMALFVNSYSSYLRYQES